MTFQDKKVALITLGCPKNDVDSEVLAGQLNHSMRLVDDVEDADVILINTCGFIEPAKKESIDAILEAVEIKKQSPEKKVFAWGCLAERYGNELMAEIPELDGLFGVEPFDAMRTHFLGKDYRRSDEARDQRLLSTPPHTAYLKIADGCNHGCTFCAIPNIKGSYRSRPLDSLIEEGHYLAELGVKEITLIAQDTSYYGRDWNSNSVLVQLIEGLIPIQGIEWIRIMYVHPNHLSNALLDLIADADTVCNYIDLPLQHISDPILKRMGRRTNRLEITDLIYRLRNRIQNLTLRTAFIAGFPGETPSQFQELMDFIQEIRFERLGVFAYSSEEGTPASQLDSHLPPEIIAERVDQLMQVQQEISIQKNGELIGHTLPVLVDGYDEDKTCFFGRTQGDALDIDQTVWITPPAEIGCIQPILIEDSSAYDLSGRLVSEV